MKLHEDYERATAEVAMHKEHSEEMYDALRRIAAMPEWGDYRDTLEIHRIAARALALAEGRG